MTMTTRLARRLDAASRSTDAGLEAAVATPPTTLRDASGVYGRVVAAPDGYEAWAVAPDGTERLIRRMDGSPTYPDANLAIDAIRHHRGAS